MTALNPKYKALYSTDKRYIILTGGRGSGKTFAVKDCLVRLMEDVGQGILYTRYTMTSVKDTIIPLFLKHIDMIGDSRNYRVTANKVINKSTGSFVMFSGIKAQSKDQTARLKTLPDINIWVVEEAEDYNKAQSFTDIDDSIRDKDKVNRIILILNPTTRHHFIYKRFFEGHHKKELIKNGAEWVTDGETQYSTFQRCTHPDVEHIHTTYYDNIDNLNEKKVEQWELVKEQDPEKWTNKYGGSWIDIPKGAVFKNINWIDKFPNHISKIAHGMDFGYVNDPTTLVRCGVSDGELYAEMLLHEVGLITSNIDGKTSNNINDRLLQMGFNRNAEIIADSSHPVTIRTMQKLRWRVKKCRKGQGSIVSGIDKIRSYKKINIVYCKEWSYEQFAYIYDENRKTEGLSNNPIDSDNHLWDALRYGIQGLSRGMAQTRVS